MKEEKKKVIGKKVLENVDGLADFGRWRDIIFVMWRDPKPYDENYHLANITRQKKRQAT